MPVPVDGGLKVYQFALRIRATVEHLCRSGS
jgi:hypothetical protein